MRRAIGVFVALGVIALVAAPAASAKEYYRGCLVGTHDNYVLRSDDGQLYRLHSHSEDDFKAHLGDIVEIKGRLSDHDREREAQEQTPAENAAGVEIPRHGLNVSHIKTVSHGCAEVKNGIAVIVPVPVPATSQTSQTTTTTVPGTAAAQTTTTTTTSGSALPQSAVVITENDANNPALQHFVGCLVGTDDFFVLRATDGQLYRLRSIGNLREHVGETVDVAGRIDNTRREIDAQRQAELAQQIGVAIPQMGINVANVRTVAKGCSTEPR
jgi:hypothetical protein